LLIRVRGVKRTSKIKPIDRDAITIDRKNRRIEESLAADARGFRADKTSQKRVNAFS